MQMRSNFWRHVARYCFLLLLMVLPFTAARAQQTLGSINGTVLDASGAAIPGSAITVTDPDIGVTRTAAAGSNGYFQIFNLPVGTYTVQATHDGFDTTKLAGILVKEASAATVNVKMKVGEIATSINVTASPMLNATDTTNGYTLDQEQIALTPLATGSFTQLAILSPGINSELLSGLNTNAGLGNQPIWANGQRDTSNTFQINGADSTNLFNGDSASADVSQRYQFNIGESNGTGNSVFGSNGNSLPSPPPEFTQELRVNTSLYDAQQGATSGAQIDVNTIDGTNSLHGQVYGTFANNYANADPFFDKQKYLLAQQGDGVFPDSLSNPALHRWTTGATLGGPIKKDKLFFFLAYQHLYASDEDTAYSQLTVPQGLTSDRSITGINNALTSWNGGTAITGLTYSQQAIDLLQAKLPNGQYLVPSAGTGNNGNVSNVSPLYGTQPNVLLQGVSVLAGDMANASIDYQATTNDRLSVKYFYQNNPNTTPFGYADTFGFPTTEANSAEVGAVDNTISIGSRLNWEQRIGYVREGTYSYYNQGVTDTTTPSAGGSFGINASALPGSTNPLLLSGLLPGIDVSEFGVKANSGGGSLVTGPYSAFVDTGYHQNRVNPSSNVIFTLGKHTIVAGGGYSYTQLNITNNRTGHGEVNAQNFEDFLEGQAYKSSNVLDSIDPTTGKNDADRYYRSNEAAAYVQDKWQAEPNLSITAGVRYDYHGGFTEKYGNLFNFDPSHYSVAGTDTAAITGGCPLVGGVQQCFTVTDAGFVVAPNNKELSGVAAGDIAGSDSTLTGRQWGISPRIGFAWSPEADAGKLVISGGAGIYYDRGELFQYLSQPAGGATGGPFGVTESSPLTSYVTASGKTNTFAAPFAVNSSPALPTANPVGITKALQTQLNTMTASTTSYGANCGGVGQQEDETCSVPLNFASYNPANKLPYTINFTLGMQWQPTNDLAVSIAYVGNRGRHSIIPIPLNEPQIVTASNPQMIGGANPHSDGESSSYGYEVLNSSVYADKYDDYSPITTEPWDNYDGGNADWRVPYVGFNPNATFFSSVGISAYDALETHLEKRLSHHFQAGVSYTWSHALDEQSDIGLFFTGNNPADLHSSYASSDFDRTHVITGNFQVQLPNAVQSHSFVSYFTNGWALTGIGVVQSGEPYSLYEYGGAVSSINYGNYPSLENPVIGIANPSNPNSTKTGNRGVFRGAGASYVPALDPSQLAINYLAPGQKGIPTAAMSTRASDPVDIYETDAAIGNQRNIFRQAMQRRLDLSLRKTFKVGERFGIQYAFNVYNVFNTTSEDVPNNHAAIRQTNYDCSSTALAANGGNNNCENKYTFSQVATSNSTVDQQSALAHLDQRPVFNGTGKSITVPLTIPIGTGPCIATGAISTAIGCNNNDASFGSVSGTIGGSRALTMSLHITY
jgi:hypothetical protein